MSSTLALVAKQILDKGCKLVTGPVVGTVTATATGADVELSIGQQATLTGGRLVRVTKRTTVTSSGTAVPVRLEYLGPSVPTAGNFAAVPAATVATWVSPPAGIAATGPTSEFAAGALATGLEINALVEHDSADTAPDLHAAGAKGTAALILVSPTVRNIGGPAMYMVGQYEAQWKLRLVLGDLGKQQERRGRVRDVFTAIVQAMHGAAAGDDIIRVGDWTQIKQTGWQGAWETTLFTRLEIDGVPMLEVNEDFTEVGISVRLPEDIDQPSPFRVEDDVDAG